MVSNVFYFVGRVRYQLFFKLVSNFFARYRTTGDGYYEAVIKDPDGNLIEIVA